MITFFLGDDVKKREAAFDAALKKATAKGGVSVHSFDDLTFTPLALEEVLGSLSFFDTGTVLVLRAVGGRAENVREIVERKELLLETPHQIFWIEESLPKELKKAFEKKDRAEMFEYELPEIKKENSALTFPTADAFVRESRKGAWVGLAQMYEGGVSGEQFFWGLWWKVKDALGKTPEGPRRDALVVLSQKLVVAYHESKRGGPSLEDSLELISLSFQNA